MFDLSDQMRGEFLLIEANLEMHLVAIKVLLKRNRKAEVDYSEQIKVLEAGAREVTDNEEYNQHLVDQVVDAMHMGVYHDAANSMAAVGMLAPLVESLFAHLFRQMRSKYPRPVSGPRARFSDDRFWDPRWYAASKEENDRQDLPLGLKQLAQHAGLAKFLPDDYQPVISALFAYRNNMLHNGFEWPPEKRKAFGKRIVAEGWSSWFSNSTSGGDPWIYYMTESFIAHCLTFIDKLVPAAGAFHRKMEKPC